MGDSDTTRTIVAPNYNAQHHSTSDCTRLYTNMADGMIVTSHENTPSVCCGYCSRKYDKYLHAMLVLWRIYIIASPSLHNYLLQNAKWEQTTYPLSDNAHTNNHFSSSLIFKLCKRRIRLQGLLVRPVSPSREGILFQNSVCTWIRSYFTHLCENITFAQVFQLSVFYSSSHRRALNHGAV